MCIKFDGPGPLVYGFDWAWSGMGLVFMGLGWAGLRILGPIPNTGFVRLRVDYVRDDVNSTVELLPWACAAGPDAVLPTCTGRNLKENRHLEIDIYQIDI